MSRADERIRKLDTEETAAQLRHLYGQDEAELAKQQKRYEGLIRRHEELFGEKEKLLLVSAPGRAEIGGNHTDHNHGRVLAASVNLDTLCAVSPREDLKVCFFSDGYAPIEMDLADLAAKPEEQGTTTSLIRGVAAGMAQNGYRIGGFDAAVTSTVVSGSGLSSSAALEVMLTGVMDALFNHFEMPYVLRAVISQKAENEYFGKPSGLLDQMASAAGGLVTVDFGDSRKPEIEAISYDFEKKGYALVVVATGGSHADLTDHYAAIPAEMKAVAAFYGQPVLRGLTAEQLMADMDSLRQKCSERAIIRAFHFIRENDRVPEQVAALKEDRIGDFLKLIIDSGRSSFMYLQNVFADNGDQSLSLALCMAEAMLKDTGAWRIHGGGFAGTTLNFVPLGQVESFVAAMQRAFGENACYVLNIRPAGAAVISL